jgi:hypothetical protein
MLLPIVLISLGLIFLSNLPITGLSTIPFLIILYLLDNPVLNHSLPVCDLLYCGTRFSLAEASALGSFCSVYSEIAI